MGSVACGATGGAARRWRDVLKLRMVLARGDGVNEVGREASGTAYLHIDRAGELLNGHFGTVILR